MDKIIMSRKEREQLKVFEKLVAGDLTQKAAGQMLNVSDRWIRTKLKRYREQGDVGLVHQGRGKQSSKRWDSNERALTIDLLKSEWHGFGPTFVAEKLKELKGITISDETVRLAMIAEGLWVPGKRKQKHRKLRERKLMVGILVQLDGSPHDWFEGRAPKCTLLVFIDDATSKILWLEFVESESFDGVAGAAKKYIETHGRPIGFYVDYGSVFSVNLNNPDRDKTTQFERIMQELAIKVNHANSPQAKGRVERCNSTMQDRLVKEMRLAGIFSMEQANKFVQQGDFIKKHNAKFAVPPAQEGDAHRSTQGYDLDKIFCTQEERVVTNDFTISYKGKVIQLTKHQPAIIRPKNRVIVCQHLDGKMTVRIRNCQLNFEEIGMRKTKELSPVEYVNNGKMSPALPLVGVLREAMNNHKLKIEKRNFSCC
jgi:transposase